MQRWFGRDIDKEDISNALNVGNLTPAKLLQNVHDSLEKGHGHLRAGIQINSHEKDRAVNEIIIKLEECCELAKSIESEKN